MCGSSRHLPPTFARPATPGRPVDGVSDHHIPASGTTRIGDDRRRDTDALLTSAMSLGYLSFDEWQLRTDQVRTAATAADLAAVTADLPVAELRRADPVRRASAADAARRTLRTSVAGWLALAALMIAIWLAVAIPTGAWYPWPVWPILGTGIGLVSHIAPVRAALRHG